VVEPRVRRDTDERVGQAIRVVFQSLGERDEAVAAAHERRRQRTEPICIEGVRVQQQDLLDLAAGEPPRDALEG
jgi:hypothetical protein